MAGISDKALKGQYAENKIRFQKQELQNKEFSDGSGLEMYEFKYRMDDPQTGRFWSIDPLASKYVYNSTYAFSENKVTSNVELEGLESAPLGYGIGWDMTPQQQKDFTNGMVEQSAQGLKIANKVAIMTTLILQPEIGIPWAMTDLTGIPVFPAPQAFATTGVSVSTNLVQSETSANNVPVLPGVPSNEVPKLDGSFSLTKEAWSRYPTVGNVPKPEGPFIEIGGQEYKDALKAKNAANGAIHKNDPSLKGLHLHEIHPVKFNGSPTDPANKIPLLPEVHQEYTNFWNAIMFGNKKL